MNANSYGTPGTGGGNREDLSDTLTILEPEETPYTSSVKKVSEASATYVEVLGDVLRAPRTSGTPEGKDNGKGNNKVSKRKRFGTYVHRIQDEYGVTDVQQAISKRGGVASVADEFAGSKAKTLREMKRDIEAVCVADQEHNGANDSDMTTRGCFRWVNLQGGSNTQTTNKVPDDFLHSATSATGTATVTAIKTMGAAASAITFTEDDLTLMLQALNRIHGGKRTYTCLFGDNLQNVVDHFTRTNSSTTNTRYRVQSMADEYEITLMVKVFDSSFGRCEFVSTQFNKLSSSTSLGDPDAGLILYMPLWYLDFLEEMHAEDNPPTAAGQDGWAKAMFANCCKMPKGNGKVTQ